MSEYLGIPLYEMCAFGRYDYQEGGKEMTQAAKMAEEWGMKMYMVGRDLSECNEFVSRIIHQVAERTREECFKVIYEHSSGSPRISTDAIAIKIRNARWEDK